MKHPFLIIAAALLWSTMAAAQGVRYELRVDGLACPFCAYGIEKKFKKTKGVEAVDIDLERGLVVVSAGEGVQLTREQVERIVKDAGFTLRSMTEKTLP